MSCPSCPETSAFVARTCLEWRCDCGKLHRVPTELVRRPSDGMNEPEWALENLEKWLWFLEGRSQRLDSPWEVPKNKRLRRERKKPIRMAPEEIERIAAGHDDPDPDRIAKLVADNFEQISKAAVALRRLEWMMSRTDQTRHAVVLMLVYLMSGSDTRSKWRSDGGLDVWVGYLCVGRVQREAWLTSGSPSWAEYEAGIYGERLLREARSAWKDLPPEANRACVDRGRLRIGEAREHLQRAISETYEDIFSARSLRDNGALEVAS